MIKNDVIEKRGNKWVLLSKDRSKVLGEFGSRAAALKREREIAFFKRQDRLDSEPKTSKLTAPLNIERDYQKEIRKITTRIKDIINKNIVQLLPTIMAEVNAKRIDSIHFDQTIGEKVEDLFKATRVQVGEEITDFEINNMVQAKASEISTWNKVQITRVLKQALGIDIFQGEPFLAEELNVWAINNVNLIKSNNAAFLNQTEQIVYDGMRRGLRHEEIAKQILGIGKDELGKVSRFKNAKTRANLIGRDQVNKLNGQLNRLRQTNIGVKTYKWRTVGDTRVRSRHKRWEGDIVLWSKGKNGGIHPGDEIQCRCWPEPIVESIEQTQAEAAKTVTPEKAKPEIEKPKPKPKVKKVKVEKPKPKPKPKVKEPKVEKPKETVKMKAKLTDLQKSELTFYKENGFKEVNANLRKNPDFSNDTVKRIDASLKKGVLTEDTTVYRGFNSKFLKSNPKELVGKTLKDPSFMSTSKSKGVASSFGDQFSENQVILKINVKKGTNAIEMKAFESGTNRGEQEILFGRNKKIKIIGSETEKGKTILIGEIE